MKNKHTTWESSLISLADASDGEWQHYHNPSLRYAQFVFCDDQPNENGQGVEYEDFPEVMASAIGTPVKMRFLGENVSAHIGSIPIGHITDMEERTLESGVHQLVAQATLYAADFPDEIQYLEEAFAANKAPGISFEMAYQKAIVKNGVNWLKGLVTRAATFVRNPAYGTRTALLALASNNKLTDEEFAEGLNAIANEIRPKSTDKGGNNTMTEEEIKKLQSDLEAAQATIKDLTAKVDDLTTANASLTTERDDLSTKVTEHETALAAVARRELIAKRTALLAEAGVKMETDPEKLAKKQSFWASMEEETFNEYVDDLKSAITVVKKETPALASLRASASAGVPRLTPDPENTGGVAVAELKERLSFRNRMLKGNSDE